MDTLTVISGMLGGLGLLIYGMKLMGDGLQNVIGEKLKFLFEKISDNPFRGIAVGALITTVIQSSSATTVMVVGFVNAGLMNIYQAAAVIIGANVGTTVTGQLLAFKLEFIAPAFVGIGIGIILLTKGKRKRETGNILLGFGFMFLGMKLLENSMLPIAKTPLYSSIILTIKGNIVIGILVGMCMTVIVQSSAATIGLLMALAVSVKMPLEVLLPVLFGDNIGSCVTALLSSVGTSKTAKRAALIHLNFNIIGTVLFSIILFPLIRVLENISPGDVRRQIANAHTIFNLGSALIQVWIIPYLVSIVNKVIPGEDRHIGYVGCLDERLLETPVIAVGQTIKEIINMANKAKENVELSMMAFETDDENAVGTVYENEKIINFLEKDITEYLVKLSKEQLSEEQLDIVTTAFHVINDVERIGDHAENLAELTTEKIEKRLFFSEDAMEDLRRMYNCTIEALRLSIQSFADNDIKGAQNVLQLEDTIDSIEEELRETNIKRLNSGVCNANCSAIFLDIISNLERVGDHSTNIAEAIINKLI